MNKQRDHSARSRLFQQSHESVVYDDDDDKEEQRSSYINNIDPNSNARDRYVSVIKRFPDTAFNIFTKNTITIHELTKFGEKKGVLDEELSEIIKCFNYYPWNASFFDQSTSKRHFTKNLRENNVRAGVATALWLKCCGNNHIDNTLNTLDENIDVVYASQIKSENDNEVDNDNRNIYVSVIKRFGGFDSNVFNIFNENTITIDELIKFGADKGISDDQFSELISCFYYYPWNASFFAQATSKNKKDFKTALRDHISAGVVTKLWIKCGGRDGINNNKPAAFDDDTDVIYTSEIKQENDIDTDVDPSYFNICGLSASDAIPATPQIKQLWSIHSLDGIVQHLVNNCWCRQDNSYCIDYIDIDKTIKTIYFYYYIWGKSKNERKNELHGSNWTRCVYFYGQWGTKRVDVHIHINVVTLETNVNIELYPNETCPTGEKYREGPKIFSIGRLGKYGHNNYVCSQWVTKDILKQMT